MITDCNTRMTVTILTMTCFLCGNWKIVIPFTKEKVARKLVITLKFEILT